MRTTLNLDENLYKKAAQVTGIAEKTKLLHLGLETLIRQAVYKDFSSLFGTVKKAKAPRRRRIK